MAHKKLLQAARKGLQQEQRSCHQKIQKTQAKITELQAAWGREMGEALIRHLVHDRLTEIPGIGERRQADILRYVYKGQLADLRLAHRLPGIGEQTQRAINQWVTHYQRNFAKVLETNFPGKVQVNDKYQLLIQAEEKKMAAARGDIKAARQYLDRIQPELAWLESISAKAFYRALKNPATNSPELSRYLQGVFAEWEPTPDWFQKVLVAAHIRQLPEDGDGRQTAVPAALSRFVPATLSQLMPQAGNNRLGLVLLLSGALCFCCFGSIALPAMLSTLDNPAVPTLAPTLTAVPSATPTAQPSHTLTPPPTATTEPEAAATAVPTDTATPTATPTITATAAPQTLVRVEIGGANVRAEPDASASVVEVVRAGDILPVLESNEDKTWFLVGLPDGRKGWIGSSVIALVVDATEEP